MVALYTTWCRSQPADQWQDWSNVRRMCMGGFSCRYCRIILSSLTMTMASYRRAASIRYCPKGLTTKKRPLLSNRHPYLSGNSRRLLRSLITATTTSAKVLIFVLNWKPGTRLESRYRRVIAVLAYARRDLADPVLFEHASFLWFSLFQNAACVRHVSRFHARLW